MSAGASVRLALHRRRTARFRGCHRHNLVPTLGRRRPGGVTTYTCPRSIRRFHKRCGIHPAATRTTGRSDAARGSGSGLRPTVRFTIAFAFTLAWVVFSVWVSDPWRDELEAAIGPVMGWVIPLFLAYIPGLVIGS